MNRRDLLMGVVAAASLPAAAVLPEGQWTRRSGMSFLAPGHRSVDPVLLMADEQEGLWSLFRVLHEHPNMQAYQAIEMVIDGRPDKLP